MPNHETWEYISCRASSQAVVVLIVWLNRRNVTCATLTWQFSRDENYLHLFTPGLDVGRRGRSPPSVYQQPYCRTPGAIISSSPPANAWLEFIPVTTVSISPPAAAGFRVCLAPAGRFKNGKGKMRSDHEMRSPLHRFLCVVIRWMSLEEISVDVLEKKRAAAVQQHPVLTVSVPDKFLEHRFGSISFLQMLHASFWQYQLPTGS